MFVPSPQVKHGPRQDHPNCRTTRPAPSTRPTPAATLALHTSQARLTHGQPHAIRPLLTPPLPRSTPTTPLASAMCGCKAADQGRTVDYMKGGDLHDDDLSCSARGGRLHLPDQPGGIRRYRALGARPAGGLLPRGREPAGGVGRLRRRRAGHDRPRHRGTHARAVRRRPAPGRERPDHRLHRRRDALRQGDGSGPAGAPVLPVLRAGHPAGRRGARRLRPVRGRPAAPPERGRTPDYQGTRRGGAAGRAGRDAAGAGGGAQVPGRRAGQGPPAGRWVRPGVLPGQERVGAVEAGRASGPAGRRRRAGRPASSTSCPSTARPGRCTTCGPKRSDSSSPTASPRPPTASRPPRPWWPPPSVPSRSNSGSP